MPRRPAESATERQLDLFRFIVSYLQEHCFQPNIVEMQLEFDVTRNAIVDRLKGLERHGFIRLLDKWPQGRIELVGMTCTVGFAKET